VADCINGLADARTDGMFQTLHTLTIGILCRGDSRKVPVVDAVRTVIECCPFLHTVDLLGKYNSPIDGVLTSLARLQLKSLGMSVIKEGLVVLASIITSPGGPFECLENLTVTCEEDANLMLETLCQSGFATLLRNLRINGYVHQKNLEQVLEHGIRVLNVKLRNGCLTDTLKVAVAEGQVNIGTLHCGPAEAAKYFRDPDGWSRLGEMDVNCDTWGASGVLDLVDTIRSAGPTCLRRLTITTDGDWRVMRLLLRAVASNPGLFPYVEYLSLGTCRLAIEDLALAVRAGAFPCLKHLHLDHSMIEDVGAILLKEAMESGVLQRIEGIDLTDNHISLPQG